MTDWATTVGHSEKMRDLKGTRMQCNILVASVLDQPVCFTNYANRYLLK